MRSSTTMAMAAVITLLLLLIPDLISAAEEKSITHVVYSEGTKAYAVNPGEIPVVKGKSYRVNFEILRNDLGSDSEYVTMVVIQGRAYGGCNPDGGDYDCTFYNCTRSAPFYVTASSDTLYVEVRIVGHSWDCDCDIKTWQCSKENTIGGRTKMTAVGRFTLFYLATSEAPTSSPTIAPSRWFQAPSHKLTIENLTTVVPRLEEAVAGLLKREIEHEAIMDTTINNLRAELSTTRSQLNDTTSTLSTTVAQLAATNDELSSRSAQLGSTQSALDKLRGDLQKIGSMTVVDGPKQPAGSPPQIEANADGDMVLQASSGKMLLKTNDCNDVDVCQSTQTLDQLKLALKNL